MRRQIALFISVIGILLAASLAPSGSQAGVFDHIRGEPAPPSLPHVARMIDDIQEDILNQGTVVVKQPDVWSQARMTKFRKEFEDTMRPELANFQRYLSGRIARSDAAALSSQTSLGASLTPLRQGVPAELNSFADVRTERNDAVALLGSTTFPLPGTATPAFNTPAVQNFTLMQGTTPTTARINSSGVLETSSTPFGIEPNVNLDQKADYITHLHRIRRVNLGDDNADSAGYGLYLMRVPVSIQPGDKTVKGHGAIVNMTMSHDFGPRFLPSTYRNLVINDIVDKLAPVVHDLARSGKAYDYNNAVQQYLRLKSEWKKSRVEKGEGLGERREGDGPPTVISGDNPPGGGGDPPGAMDSAFEAATPEARNLKGWSQNLLNRVKDTARSFGNNRSGQRTNAIAPSDVPRVFVPENLLNLAYAAQRSLGFEGTAYPLTHRINVTDVRSFLRHELESAYDLMEGRCKDQVSLLMDVEYIESLADQVACRKFEGPKGVPVDSDAERNEFYTLYESFTNRLPGNLRFRSIGILSWAIAIEAGLLNRQLREDMKQTKGADGYTCPVEVDQLLFYPPTPLPEAETAFQDYIRARWPMITFSLEPVTDQQNIEDAFTRRRDLQLAVAFALSSGRISFRQALQFNRQLQSEAQTIALNQTVSAFSHGNDTFGWRFTPRFQTQPEESNGRAIANLLLRGGPGPNYQLKNSKIEPGMRELTAVVVMPSFVRSMRLDVDSNWFHLHDPDDRKIHTARTVELGRRINEARQALAAAHSCGLYRAEDTERLRVKLHQLERMLPMQSQFVKVPYENTLGGFSLFTQGVSALVPELSGYEGIEYIDPEKPTELIVYGKDFSIYETAVVAGGLNLIREVEPAAIADRTSGQPQDVSKPKDAAGQTIPDTVGSYNILSREVMRVRIPAKVATSTLENTLEVVELHVSTPNGISNRLQIPVEKKPKAQPAPAFSPRTTAAAYTIINPRLTLVADAHLADKKVKANALRPYQGVPIRVQPVDVGTASATVSLEVTFSLAATTTSPPIIIADVPFRNGAYEVDAARIDDFADELFQLHRSAGVDVPASLPSTRVRVQSPASNGTLPDASETLNQLTVEFNFILGPPPAANGAAAAALTVATPAKAVVSVAPERTRGPEIARDDDPAIQRASHAISGPTPGSTRLAAMQSQADATLSPPTGVAAPTLPAAAPAAAAATTPAATAVPSSSQTLVVMPPRAPSVNVSVPITNTPPPKKHQGLFRRQAPATSPVAPARGPLLERIMGRP